MSIGSELLYSRNRCRPKAKRRRTLRWVVCVCLVFLWELDVSFESLLVSAEKASESNKPFTTAIYESNWEMIETYAHDPSSFTQGLEVHPSSVIPGTCQASSSSAETCSTESDTTEEQLLVTESTGMRGDSLLRIWDLVTGDIQKETKMESHLFGEGSTFFVDQDGNEKIAVLTYQEDTILVYDANSLDLLDTIRPWPSPTTTNEGWGIAFDPLRKLFVVTDGSEYLHFWNTNFEEVGDKIPVVIEKLIVPHDDGSIKQVIIPHISERDDESSSSQEQAPSEFRVTRLNELEWDGATQTLLANRWGEKVVLRIDPRTGIVTRVYDFWDVQKEETNNQHHREDVFNGIAIVPNTDGKEWLVTGKWWPQVYRVRILE